MRKALAKDPDRRYASVTALIRDVQCYQRNEPVSAREPAAVYVLRKFVARPPNRRRPRAGRGRRDRRRDHRAAVALG